MLGVLVIIKIWFIISLHSSLCHQFRTLCMLFLNYCFHASIWLFKKQKIPWLKCSTIKMTHNTGKISVLFNILVKQMELCWIKSNNFGYLNPHCLGDCFESKKPKSALSANLQVVPSWVLQFMCLRDGMPSLGSRRSLGNGPMGTSGGATRLSASAAPGSGKPLAARQPGGWGNWEWLCGEGLGGAGGWEDGYELAMSSQRPVSQPQAGLHQEKCGQQAKGGDSHSLLHSCDTTPAVLHSDSGALSTGRTWTCWSKCRGRPWRWSEGWITSPMQKIWEFRLFSQKKRLWGDLIASSSS